MPDDDKKPVVAPPATPSKDGQAGQPVPFTSAADQGEQAERRAPTPGLSYAAGLSEVPGSTAPAMADGSSVPHVWGPGQAAVDPIAAGLDWKADVATRNELRPITQTGELGAGPRPSTYAEKRLDVPQAAPATGETKQAPTDVKAAEAPGPSGASA